LPLLCKVMINLLSLTLNIISPQDKVIFISIYILLLS